MYACIKVTLLEPEMRIILAFKLATFVLLTKKSGGKKWDNGTYSYSFLWGQRDYPT